MTNLKSIRNIGEKMSVMLIKVGIPDAESLQAVGAREAQLRLLNAGFANHVLYYQSLKLGLMNRAWNDVEASEKVAFKAEFKEIQAEAKLSFTLSEHHDLPPIMSRQLKEIGVL